MGAAKTILIIEDEPGIVECIEEAFQGSDFELQKTDNFPEALSRCANQKYCLLIVDIKIKKGLGTDLVKKLRADTKGLNATTPVIVISGHLDAAAIESVKGQIQGAFVKPFDNAKLVELSGKLAK